MQIFTFLFTDIEGSTALLRRLGPAAYAQVLAEYHDVMRSGWPLATFIGRDAELAEVRDLIASSRLVTLTGAGGTGKEQGVELAAARLRSISLNGLRDRLDQRFRLLTGGSRVALERQQTLRATVDWS